MRTFSPSPTIGAPALPLHEAGVRRVTRSTLRLAPVLRQTIRAPKIPINQLGWLAASTAQAIAPIASKVTTETINALTDTGSTAAASSGGFWAAAAGPIGAGVGVLIGILGGLWAAHEARANGATSENAAVNSAIQAYDASLKAIFSAANSGQITAAQAISALQSTQQSYFSGMAPYEVGPGRSDSSNGGTNCTPGICTAGNTHCTAGCCVGCDNIIPDIQQAMAVFQSPTGGTLTVSAVGGLAKYGATPRASYTLTYTPPAASSSVSSLVSSVTGGGSSMLPLLLIGGVALFFFARGNG